LGYFLFLFYFVSLGWLLTRIRFIQKAGLNAGMLVLLFSLKVLAGMFSGWMLKNNPDSDTWGYHKDALVEYQLLFTHPSEYFTNLFYTGYQYGYDGILQFHNSYWNDLKTNLMVKFVSVLHLFSFGHYYVNVVLYNFLVFFGHIALVRMFQKFFTGKNAILIITCFLLPSLLLFSSAIHKEGLIFSAISITCYCFYDLISLPIFSKRKMLLLVLSVLFIFLLRSYILIVLIPALTGWYIAYKMKSYPAIVFSLVFILGVVIFFNVNYFFPWLNMPQMVVQKQVDFLGLGKANSSIEISELTPTFRSFIRNAPEAISHTMLRPYFRDYFVSLPLLPFIVELMLYQFLFILFLFFRRIEPVDKPFIFFCISFSIIIFLIVGYIVPVLWAIVRYKSIYLPFLLTPLFCAVDFEKLYSLLFIKK